MYFKSDFNSQASSFRNFVAVESSNDLSKYLDESCDDFNCLVSTVDTNHDVEFFEPDCALFQFLPTDTPTQGLALQGSTLLEPRPLPNEDIQNQNQIGLTFKAIQQVSTKL